VLENVGVSAFIGASTLLTDKNILAAAANVLTIESRHSSIAHILNGGTSIPQSFDMGLTPSSVLALAGGFISGCDFGIKANPPLTITTKGAVGVGSQLTFTSPGITAATGQTLSCQMLTGGDTVAKSFPIDKCVVPAGINGPVYIYVTNTADFSGILSTQCTDCIVAGPTLAYIDTEPQALGSLARTSGAGKAIGADPAAGTPSGSTPGSTAPGSTGPAASGIAAPGASSASGGVAPTGAAQQDNSKVPAGSTPGLSAFDGGVVVHPSFSIPKAAAPAPAAPAAPSTSASAAAGGVATGAGGALVLPTGGAALSPVPTSA